MYRLLLSLKDRFRFLRNHFPQQLRFGGRFSYFSTRPQNAFVNCTPNFGQKFGGVSLLKYTFGIKLNTVLMVLRDHMSQHEVSRITGICRTLIREWINLYRNHGIKYLKPGINSYSYAFKLNVIDYLYENNISYRQASAIFGIRSSTTVRDWDLIFNKYGPGGFMEKRKPDSAKSKITKKSKSKSEKELSENEKLLAELQYLRMENEYLKKLNALVQKRIARENGKK